MMHNVWFAQHDTGRIVFGRKMLWVKAVSCQTERLLNKAVSGHSQGQNEKKVNAV